MQPSAAHGVSSDTVPPKLPLISILLLSAALIGAVAVAWRQYGELTELRAAALGMEDRASLEARIAELKRKTNELQARLIALQQAKTNVEYAAATAKSSEKDRAEILRAKLAAATAANESDAEAKRDQQLEVLAAMADLPEFQKLLALQQRGKVDAKYADLFKKLKLNPQELSRLQTLLAEKQSAYADAVIAARSQGLTGKEARDTALAVSKGTQKEIEGSIKSLLGAQRYGQYQNYERTEPQRLLVDQLAERLSYTSAPLSARQQDQLVQTLATTATTTITKPATNTGGKVVPAKPVTVAVPPVAPLNGALAGLGIASVASAPVTSTAIAQAQKYLSSQQIVALQQVQQEQRAQQSLNSAIAAGKPAATAAPKPTPAPTPVKTGGK